MYEAQADCWYRAGEYEKASDGYATAYRLVGNDRVAQGRLLLMRSWIEEKVGKYSRALRWAARARTALNGLGDPSAARQAARATSWYAVVLQTKGRTNEALRWAGQALTQAQAADDPEALGEAHNVMGWALGALGREGAQEHFQRSLEAYQRSGNIVRQAGILANMGLVCQWEGRWDEALSYYERGRDGSLKVGNTIPAGLARINMAEILVDRGQFADAEEHLLETMPLWRASHYRLFLGACLLLLGRASLRSGRCDEALRRLEEARTNFLSVEADEEIPAVDAMIAECRMLMGEPDAALDLANSMLKRAGASNAVARTVPLLKTCARSRADRARRGRWRAPRAGREPGGGA